MATRPTRRCQFLTYQRKVHSIETSLEETNYDPVVLPVEEKIIIGSLAPPKKMPVGDERIVFSNQQPPQAGRQRSCDVIRGVPGVTRSAKDAKSPKQGFDLFITPNVIDLIVYFTNLRIRESLEKCS